MSRSKKPPAPETISGNSETREAAAIRLSGKTPIVVPGTGNRPAPAGPDQFPMKVEMWATDRPKPYPGNPRINDQAVDAVAASIRQFGFVQPIVVDAAGVIIIGHTRQKAARALGMAEVPVVVAADLSPDQVRALRLADNKTGELAEWDKALLPKELQALLDAQFDTTELGFGDDDLDRILGRRKTGNTDPDEVPDVRPTTATKRGDLFRLGEHRLMCGDSASAADVDRLMAGDRATCVFTDPPYGVSVAAKNRFLDEFQKGGRNKTDIVDDDLSPADLKAQLLPAFNLVRTRIMADDCALLMTAPQGGDLGMMMMMMMKEAGLAIRHVLIWVKSSPTFSMGRLDYDYKHEPILFTWGKSHKKIMAGEFRNSIWQIPKPSKSPEHPTMKPVALYINAYLNHTDRGDVVADPYSGSGTALLAAEQLGRITKEQIAKGRGAGSALIAAEQVYRRCRSMEIDPHYVDVAISRWELFTGEKAVKEDA